MADLTHTHSHAHDHATAHRSRGGARFSLLRLSVMERVGGALVLVALIWASVFWALAA